MKLIRVGQLQKYSQQSSKVKMEVPGVDLVNNQQSDCFAQLVMRLVPRILTVC
jgi:hypothetical protein